MSKLLSEIAFGSYLAYSSWGTSSTSLKSKQIAHCLKRDAILPSMPFRLIDYVARRIAEERETLPFAEWLAPDVELVPVPRSSFIKEDALWPARRIATALVNAGIGRSVVPCLERIIALPSSSRVPAEERPTAEMKLKSLGLRRPLVSPKKIVIVDDVITTGSQMIAALSFLAEAFPEATIHAIAIVRTISPGEVDVIRSPCVGRVHMDGTRSVRRP